MKINNGSGHSVTPLKMSTRDHCSVAPVTVHETLASEPLHRNGIDLSDLLVAVIVGHNGGHGVPPPIRLIKGHWLGQNPHSVNDL